MRKAVKAAGRVVAAADGAAARAVKPYRKVPPVRALAAASNLGDQPPMLALAAGTLALGLRREDEALTRAGARMVIGHLIATGAKDVGKTLLDRSRPRTDDRHEVSKAGGDPDPELRSFPSGHTAGAVAVALGLGRDYPEYRAAALAAAGLIAIGQLPRRAHYSSDVAAGLAIGIAAAALADLVIPAED